MLKIGNFSRIAGVSIRLLHYYEELGLFQPAYIDPKSGYRYYKSEQILELNKILALKELNLTLQEIKLYISEEISRAELIGMLKLKKSQIYQSVEEEVLRLRRIEHHLEQLQNQEMPTTKNVIIKPIPAQHYLSVRNRNLPMDQFGVAVENLTTAMQHHDHPLSGKITILEHSLTFPDDMFDLEIGFASHETKKLDNKSIVLNDRLALHPRELPAVPQMATLLHIGVWGTGMRSYLALGQWIETHGFEIVGATREVYHEIASDRHSNNIVEFQLPIQSTERILL